VSIEHDDENLQLLEFGEDVFASFEHIYGVPATGTLMNLGVTEKEN